MDRQMDRQMDRHRRPLQRRPSREEVANLLAHLPAQADRRAWYPRRDREQSTHPKYMFFHVTRSFLIRSSSMKMDKTTFNELLETQRDHVYSYALYSLRAPEDAEDVTQEAFLRLWRSCPDTDFRGMTAWLMRVVYNLCIDQTRRRKTVRIHFGQPDTEVVDRLMAEPGVRTDPDWAVQVDEQQRTLLDAMATLSPETRNVMLMHYFEGLKFQEIAEVLDKNVSSLKVQVHRARKALRKVLTDAATNPTAEKREIGNG